MFMILIQINKLWSLEDYDPRYWFHLDGLYIEDIETNNLIPILIDRKGYPYVQLKRQVPSRSGKMSGQVKFHKIVALATISNKGPYEVIEHLDDNKLNWATENLKFSTQLENVHRYYENGFTNHIDSIYEVIMNDGTLYVGSTKEISKMSGINRGTLYDKMYKGFGERPSYRYPIISIKEISKGNGSNTFDFSDRANDENGYRIVYENKFNRSND